MREVGIDISANKSQGFDEAWIREHCDYVVTMGCGDDACPAFVGEEMMDWALDDPKGKPIEEFRVPGVVLRVLFACVGNTARSQMAQAVARQLGGGRIDARSGGSRPLGYVLSNTIAVMAEKGIDIGRAPSKGYDQDWIAQKCDLVVTLNRGETSFVFEGKRIVAWDLPDPEGQSIDVFRAVRDDIESRVRALLAELGNI